MLLRHVYLSLNGDEFPRELNSAFQFKTRYICNYLEWRLRRLKFHAAGFSKIVIKGQHVPDDRCPIVHVNAVVASFAFDQRRYEALRQDEYHEYFIGLLQDGFKKCASQHHFPLNEMLDTIEDFRRGGCKNEWIHQTKLLRPGLRASLLCSLDIERFVLNLRLDRKGEILFEDSILETKPDELIFAHRFKEVALDGQVVVVRDKFGKPTFSVNLSSLT